MKPNDNLNYLIQHVSIVVGKQSEQILREQLGIGLSQFRILMSLEWNPRIQQKAIADSLGQTEASISRQIKLLKDKGLLVSKLDPNNRRKHITAPTLRGMQVTEAATDLLRRSTNDDFSTMNEQQLHQLTNGLHQLHKIVCSAGKMGACDHQLGV